MKLKSRFETTELGKDLIAVPVGDRANEFGGVIRMNASAGAILKQLQEDTTPERIVSALTAEYEGTEEELTAYVQKVLDKLRAEKLLCE